MSETTSWKHIGLHGHSVGTFFAEKIGIRWKSALNTEDDDVVLSRFIPSKCITGGQWTVFGRSGHLRIQTTKTSETHNTSEFRFDGFPPQDYDLVRSTLAKYGSNNNIEVQKHAMDASGSSFGLTSISKTTGHLLFRQCILDEDEEEGEEFEPRDGDEMLSMNLAEVGQCVMQGNTRNEIELQFHESDTVEAGTDQLVSVRFYVPPDPDAELQDKETTTPAELFQQRLLDVAQIKNTAGNEIIQFNENQGTFLTPRGRYKITLYGSHLRMHGNRYDYKIKYDDISRLFLLPKPDDVHMAFVIALDKPIRQGQQRYQILVLQTTKETQEIKVNIDAETLAKEYAGLQPIMKGALCNLIAKSFKIIAKKKVFVSGKFSNAYQQACVKCALRANEGHLYPLERCFVFIHKPPVFIRFDEVESVEFQRYAEGAGSTRNWDLCVTIARSAGDTQPKRDYIFSGIDRSDHPGMYNFITAKGIKIINSGPVGTDGMPAAPNSVNPPQVDMGDESDSSTDDDFGSEDGESSSDEDAMEEGSEEDSDLEEARKAKKKKDAVEKKQKERQKKEREVSSSSSGKKKPNKEKKNTSKLSSSSKSSSTKSKMPSSSSTTSSKSSKSSKVNKKKSKSKKKKKKDPNAPKQALSAYFLFNKEQRAKIQSENPEAKFGDIARLVSTAFKALSDDERNRYDQMASDDKDRYAEEMKTYTPPSDLDESDSSDDDSDVLYNKRKKTKETANKKKKKKDPNAPKKPLSAYMFFNKEERPNLKNKNPSLSFGELGALVGKTFRELNPEAKEKYNRMAEEDKARYTEAMKNYTPPEDDSSSGSDDEGSSEEEKRPAKKKTKVADVVGRTKGKKREVVENEESSEADSDSSSEESSSDEEDSDDDSSSSGSD